MCETWNRIHIWIGIVLMPFQVRAINVEIRIQSASKRCRSTTLGVSMKGMSVERSL
jgi:hypothetical protein